MKKMILSAMFIAMGIILPFLTGQIPTIGQMLLPMHIPVFLCGMICGSQYGLIIGAILPLLRFVLWGVPVFYPTAIAVAFELATYGFVSGILYNRMKHKNVYAVYGAMIPAMIIGRIIRGCMELILLGIKGDTYTVQIFFASVILVAVPGIVLQLVLIPILMSVLRRIVRIEQ